VRKLYVRLSLLSGTGIEFFSKLTMLDLEEYADAIVEVLDEIKGAREDG
jgi:hypothetical protein